MDPATTLGGKEEIASARGARGEEICAQDSRSSPGGSSGDGGLVGDLGLGVSDGDEDDPVVLKREAGRWSAQLEGVRKVAGAREAHSASGRKGERVSSRTLDGNARRDDSQEGKGGENGGLVSSVLTLYVE